MSFDFDTVVPRQETDSQKWQKYRGRDIIPMWVADMDFRCPPPVLEAMHARVDEGIFGYARPVESTVQSVLSMLRRKYGWEVLPEWLVWLPGLVPGINLSCRAFCEADEEVLTITPIYPPFLSAPKLAHRGLNTVEAKRNGDHWEIDWDALKAAVTPKTRLFLLCNPHNPLSRVYRRDELIRLAQFCEERDIIICSDEIHCDLILDDLPHIPTATLGSEIAKRTVTLIAPSKTYNIAGLGCSIAIISDSSLRAKFKHAALGIISEVNNIGYAACEAAYRDGEAWRSELLAYLRGNRDFLADFIAREMPAIKTFAMEATYLAWMDVSALGLKDPVAFFEEAGVGLSDGRFFGAQGFVRMNFGCPRSTLETGLKRMRAALAS